MSIGAADAQLGPAVPLSPLGDYGPAYGSQSRPRIASNGHGFLAVWYDAGVGKLVALPLNPAGAPLATYPLPIAAGVYEVFEVASDGSDYLVVWTDANGTYTLRVDDEARAIGAPREISPKTTSIVIGSDGAGYLVAIDASRVFELSRAGSVVRQLTPNFGEVLWIGAPRGSYEIIDRSTLCATGMPCTTRVRITSTVAVAGGGTTELAAIDGENIHVAATATSDAVGIMYGIRHHAQTTVRVVDRAGNARGNRVVAQGFPVYIIGAGTDGQQFLFFATGEDESVGIHVTDFGVHRSTTPLAGASAYEAPRVASNGLREVLLTTDVAPSSVLHITDIASRSVGSFEELPAASKSILSQGHSAKKAPRFARNGSNQIVAWVDDRTSAIEGRVNGVPFTIPRPLAKGYGREAIALAAGDANFVVAWYEPESSMDDGSLFASRITYAGEVLDRIRVHESMYAALEPAVAYGGGAYLFAADSVDHQVMNDDVLHFIRMSESGELSTVRSLQEHSSVPRFEGARLVWNGREFIAAYLLNCCDLVTPHYAYQSMKVVRVSGGEPLLAGDNSALHASIAPAIATSGTRILVAEGRYDGLLVATYDRDLTPSSKELRLLGYGQHAMPEAVWNGSEFVLAWTEDRFVYALRLNARGVPLDAEPIEIAETPMTRPPALIVTDDGVRIAYEALDPEHGDAVRIYARTLPRIDAQPRRRAVR